MASASELPISEEMLAQMFLQKVYSEAVMAKNAE